jgi:hypothetical protein
MGGGDLLAELTGLDDVVTPLTKPKAVIHILHGTVQANVDHYLKRNLGTSSSKTSN